MNPYRRKIDGRSTRARELNLSGASFDANGNVTGGKDMLTRSAVNVPERTRKDIYRMGAPAGVSATESGAGRVRSASAPDMRPAAAPQFAKPTTAPMMGDQLGKMDFTGAQASTAAMRGAQAGRDVTAVAGARDSWRNGLSMKPKQTEPLTSVGTSLVTRRTTADGFANSTIGKYGAGMATNMRDNDKAMTALGGRTSSMRLVQAAREASAAGVAAVDKMDRAINVPVMPNSKPSQIKSALKMPAAKVDGPKMEIDPLKKKRVAQAF